MLYTFCLQREPYHLFSPAAVVILPLGGPNLNYQIIIPKLRIAVDTLGFSSDFSVVSAGITIAFKVAEVPG